LALHVRDPLSSIITSKKDYDQKKKLIICYHQKTPRQLYKRNRNKLAVLRIDRSLKDAIDNAKSDNESYSDYLRAHLNLEPTEVIELFKLLKRKARRLILSYVKDHPGICNSEIVEALQIVPWQVSDILYELEKEGRIHTPDKQNPTLKDLFP
jgi:hypothetical protein